MCHAQTVRQLCKGVSSWQINGGAALTADAFQLFIRGSVDRRSACACHVAFFLIQWGHECDLRGSCIGAGVLGISGASAPRRLGAPEGESCADEAESCSKKKEQRSNCNSIIFANTGPNTS